jgi:transcriptional regulator with XRE-family HTH domain
MAKKRERLSDQVRRAVHASGRSRYAICKALGLAQATMSRFMSGKGGLSMQHLDALADLLDLNITAGGKGTAKGANSGKHQQ